MSAGHGRSKISSSIRHAQASHISVEVCELDDNSAPRIVVTVRDDGRGIDPQAPKGFGILGMQERVEGLGGEYAVDSESGRGTTLRVTIPLRPAGTMSLA